MCGIAGIIGRLDEANRRALARMNASMLHRGPDAGGTWESAADERGLGVLLGHRRLSILDLSPAGAQPMVDPVSGNVIVFNGEIYNYIDLRQTLFAGERDFRSSGDTAVLLRALGTLGRSALGRLRGMFAFAFWDAQRRRLLLARDPLGIKPLYVASNPERTGGWSIAFASEVRALLASGLLGKPKLHRHAAASVVWNGFVMGPDTAVEGVESIAPGEYREYTASGEAEASQVHWSAGRPGSAAAMDVAELTHEFEECVRLHLASDVPLGVFLSGGVDSSAVANLAQRSAGGSVHTFTLAFAEPEYNEGPVARRIAEAIGTQHQEVVLTEAEFTEGLQDALDSLDQPTFDGLNSYYLSLAIRRAGFTVALVGTGGDELFGGYASFRDLPVLQKWVRNLGWLPRPGLVGAAKVASAMLAPSRGGMPPQTRWAKLPEMVRNGDNLLSLYQLAYALFLPDFQRQLLGDVAGALQDGLPDRLRSRLLGEAAGRSTLSAISTMEQRLFLGERLLRDNDAASMAASIEQRLPLVDHVLFECMDRVADPQRYSPVGRKDLLRRIGLRGLDSALFDRPKSGFELPFDRWIRAGLSDVIDRTMRDASAARAVGLDPAAVQRLWVAFLDRAPGVYWTRVWAIFILIRWCHRHEVFA